MFWNIWEKRKEIISLQIATYDCSGCGNCVRRCKRNVLKMVHNQSCSFVTVANPDNCVGCGHCTYVCGTGAIELILKG